MREEDLSLVCLKDQFTIDDDSEKFNGLIFIITDIRETRIRTLVHSAHGVYRSPETTETEDRHIAYEAICVNTADGVITHLIELLYDYQLKVFEGTLYDRSAPDTGSAFNFKVPLSDVFLLVVMYREYHKRFNNLV